MHSNYNKKLTNANEMFIVDVIGKTEAELAGERFARDSRLGGNRYELKGSENLPCHFQVVVWKDISGASPYAFLNSGVWGKAPIIARFVGRQAFNVIGVA